MNVHSILILSIVVGLAIYAVVRALMKPRGPYRPFVPYAVLNEYRVTPDIGAVFREQRARRERKSSNSKGNQ